jgi:hypothetical protein
MLRLRYICGSALYDPWSKLYKKFFDLKLVGNERKGGREAGKCSKMVSDRGSRCLSFFNFVIVFSSTYFRFPLVKPI